jgi:transketolase
LGPVANNVVTALNQANLTDKFNLLTALHLPLELNQEAIEMLRNTKNILVIEEHVSIGGLAQQLSVKLLENSISPQKFISLRAEGYPDGTYGDQNFHQTQSGLDVQNIIQQLHSFL